MKRTGVFAMAAVLAAALALAAGEGSGHPLPGARGCPIFPPNNPWNQRVDKLPVASNSAVLIKSIGLDSPLHADFGSGLYQGERIGIPYTTVSPRQRRVPVSFQDAAESNKGPYPIPPNAPIEGGSDRHVIVVQRRRCRLYELFDARREDAGRRWSAGSGAVWNLRSNHLRPAGWTSADAAGLPILPGLARYYEVREGSIDHALRFTAEQTRRAYVYPARHFASSDTDPALPPMGLRVRLKPSFDISRFPHQAQVVLVALKRYGMILADNGSPWYVSGAPSPGWSNDQLHTLDQVHGSDFEVVDTSSLPKPGL